MAYQPCSWSRRLNHISSRSGQSVRPKENTVSDSFFHRKKYRKMKIRFDAGMDEASELFNAEHRARKIAQRIQEQNEYFSVYALRLRLRLMANRQPTARNSP